MVNRSQQICSFLLISSLIFAFILRFDGAKPAHAAVTVTFFSIADSHVRDVCPTCNAGINPFMRVDAPPPDEWQAYIKFRLTGVLGKIESAKLRVFANTTTVNGPHVRRVANNWSENGITWNNRPASNSGVLDNVGNIGPNAWATFDVTSAVSGDGEISFALIPDSSDGVEFSSNQGANPPQLVVEYDPAGGVPANLLDGRINNNPAFDIAAPVAIYVYPIDIYSIDPGTGRGALEIRITEQDLETLGAPGETNQLLASAINRWTNQPIAVYRLTTGEIQVNTHFADGKPYVVAWLAGTRALYHLAV